MTAPGRHWLGKRLQRGAAGLVAGFTMLSSGAAAANPACIATAEIVPADAFVGQQLLYRLTILARDDVNDVDWIVPPRFPGFRAERLPGRPQNGVVEREGVRFRSREEHRALYAEQPGHQRIRLAGIRCEVGRGPDVRSIEVDIPEADVVVRALPEEGAPEAFSGVVGPVALRARIEPQRMALGDTLHLEVSIQGAGNLWDAPDPLPSTAFGKETAFGKQAAFGEETAFDTEANRVEVFRRRPELHLEPGSRLTVRRIFRYDIVPNAAGELTIPALGLDVFDPTLGAYVRVESQDSVVDVAPRSPAPGPRPAAARPTKARPGEDPGDGIGWSGALVVFAGVVGAGVVALLRTRRRPSPAEQALATLRNSDPSEVDADALSRALRAALADRRIDGEPSLEEQLASGSLTGPVASAVALLIELDHSRFRPESQFRPETTPPDRQAVEDALERLGSTRSAPRRWRA